MKFKEGDILIDADGSNDYLWTFVRYEEDFGGEFARAFIPDEPGKSPLETQEGAEFNLKHKYRKTCRQLQTV